MTFVGSVHNPKIMLGMLIKVLCGDAIVTRRRLSSEGNVTFEDLMSGASDFDVRTVTIEGLTSVRYLLSGTVRIVTVIVPIWSVGLSWSHDTLHFDERFGSLSGESVSGRLGGGVRRCRAAFLSSAQLSRAGTLDGSAFISNSFLCEISEAGLIAPSPCLNFAASSTWSLRRSQSSLCTARCHLMSGFEKKVSLTGDRGFESVSLQR